MADLSITAANVLPSSNANLTIAPAGVAITAGQACYIDASGNAQLSDSNGVSPANTITGIALQNVGAGQRVQLAQSDPVFAFGASVASGSRVYLSNTPGGLTITSADLASGSVAIVVGVALGATGGSATTMNLSPVVGGVI